MIHLVTRGPSRDGVLNEEGAEIVYHWTSFENMLRDIAHLDKAELESIVVWNRLLVYATLYGYAKKVNKIMKLHNIQLENAAMNLYVSCGWINNFTHLLLKSICIPRSQIQQAPTLYHPEVEVLAVVSLEAEVAEVSELSKENCHTA